MAYTQRQKEFMKGTNHKYSDIRYSVVPKGKLKGNLNKETISKIKKERFPSKKYAEEFITDLNLRQWKTKKIK